MFEFQSNSNDRLVVFVRNDLFHQPFRVLGSVLFTCTESANFNMIHYILEQKDKFQSTYLPSDIMLLATSLSDRTWAHFSRTSCFKTLLGSAKASAKLSKNCPTLLQLLQGKIKLYCRVSIFRGYNNWVGGDTGLYVRCIWEQQTFNISLNMATSRTFCVNLTYDETPIASCPTIFLLFTKLWTKWFALCDWQNSLCYRGRKTGEEEI